MPGSEEQARLLEDALGIVRQQTAMMRRCLETPGKLMDALKCWYVVLCDSDGVKRQPAYLRKVSKALF